MTFTEQRAIRSAKARELQSALGPYVVVIFDYNESGMTSFCLNTTTGLMEYLMEPNTIFDDEINVGDYAPLIGVVTYYYNRNMLITRTDFKIEQK